MPMDNVGGYYEVYCVTIYMWKKTKHPLFPFYHAVVAEPCSKTFL